MNYSKEISPKAVGKTAEGLYGDFYCSEAIVSTIVEHMELDIPREYIVAMSSGYAGGLGGSKCLCGAVSGGVMSLGLFFGRSEAGDEKIKKMMSLSNQLHDWFKEENKTLCCRVLTRNLQWEGPEHKKQCAHFTGMVAEKVALMLVEELGLVNLDLVATSSESE